MAGDAKKLQPIIIKRVKKGGHAVHGGAWKIAYADFVTAMMAFFLLMWLLGSTTEGDKKGIADYFQSPLKVALLNAGVTVLDAMPVVNANTPAAPGDTPVSAPDAVLEILTDQREKSVVGSTAAGQVREFQLRVRFRFRLSTPRAKELIADAEVLMQRDISYSETIALSKLDEEAEMYKDMQSDIVQQVLRRLASVRSL